MSNVYNARLALSCALGFGVYDEITIGDEVIKMNDRMLSPALKIKTNTPERKAFIKGKTKKEKRLKKKRGY